MRRRELLALPLAWGALGRASAAGKYTDKLWQQALPLYRKMLAHPFLTGLADGTLPMEKFRYYMLQDAIYLGRYAKALNVVAAKAPTQEISQFFSEGAIGCIKEERQMHAQYFSAAELKAARMAPTCAAYTNHMLAVAHQGTFADGVAAVTPCYWIYAEVGRELIKRGSKNKDYQQWINQYGGESYGVTVKRELAVVDGLTHFDAASFEEHFMASVRYEYLFWDMAWRLEKWEH